MNFIFVFLFGFILDILYVLWIYYTTHKKALPSAFLSTFITGVGLFSFINITEDRILALPYLTGIFLGCIVGVQIQRKLDAKASKGS